VTTLPLAERETAVYRLFDINKTLLYVGISWDPDIRMKDHEANSPWWPDVKHMAAAWYRNRENAMAHASWPIATESPLHNTRQPDPNRYDPSKLEGEIVRLPGLPLEWLAKHFAFALHNSDIAKALAQWPALTT
jgi:hypothetical protein